MLKSRVNVGLYLDKFWWKMCRITLVRCYGDGYEGGEWFNLVHSPTCVIESKNA